MAICVSMICKRWACTLCDISTIIQPLFVAEARQENGELSSGLINSKALKGCQQFMGLMEYVISNLYLIVTSVDWYSHKWDNRQDICIIRSGITSSTIGPSKNSLFLHDRLWILPWIKSISSELDITCHIPASQLSGHCDIIANRLWRHQQNIKVSEWDTGTMCEDPRFSIIYGFVMLCE